ncbi:hypothetical protein BDA99DRAFT_533893 [Phascolomyces articulosus]|uniref:Uncharacterized protein n=1 Tax=Phascolomyces articulosus TaxID=60185 RepID=A0AAD5K7V5_9FUNG|nr:hypothetical protein BDA99DRAFT_533893 [Phascolomyces articulosus]
MILPPLLADLTRLGHERCIIYHNLRTTVICSSGGLQLGFCCKNFVNRVENLFAIQFTIPTAPTLSVTNKYEFRNRMNLSSQGGVSRSSPFSARSERFMMNHTVSLMNKQQFIVTCLGARIIKNISLSVLVLNSMSWMHWMHWVLPVAYSI